MNSFRTTIKTTKQIPQIDYSSKIVLLGSCFTTHISEKLTYFKFRQITNPFGILFNSSAIKTAISHCTNNSVYTKKDLKKHDELWLSLNHHTAFSSKSYTSTLEAINSKIGEAHSFLKEASHIIITLGTAWVYTYKKSNVIVGNCHKIPQDSFDKSLQSIAAITEDLKVINTVIKSLNPNCTILYTVSPIRHLRDGFTGNSLSKAHLLTAVQTHITNASNSYYIPAYEIMLDDLRDYRFYTDDMIHPNSTAIDYIWKFFKQSWISDKVFPIMDEINSIQKSLQHRPFNTETESYRKFKNTLDKKITEISKKNPHIKF